MFRRSAMLLLLLSAALGFAAKKNARLIAAGNVEFADSTTPLELVAIERVCNGVVETVAYADSDGDFRIDYGPAENVDRSKIDGCTVRAFLPGYRSDPLPLVRVTQEHPEIGTLKLLPEGKQPKAARSHKDTEATKPAQKLFGKGLSAAAKADWKDAEDLFEQATSAFHWYASAWLSMGILQERKGDLAGAKKSFQEAISDDDAFALPRLYVAEVEIARQEWQEALADSAKVIEMDAAAFPLAHLLNAQANLNLHHTDQAIAGAREALKFDEDHRWPEAEYVLALALIDKGDRAGAAEHLESYLAREPRGECWAAAREQLERLKSKGEGEQ